MTHLYIKAQRVVPASSVNGLIMIHSLINSLLNINRLSLSQGDQSQNKLDVYIFCEQLTYCYGAVCRRQHIALQ